jgi:hypothetical protein
MPFFWGTNFLGVPSKNVISRVYAPSIIPAIFQNHLLAFAFIFTGEN